jgi:hypothetical protein
MCVHKRICLSLATEHLDGLYVSAVCRCPVFGLKKDEMTEGWRKVHNKELHNLYSSSSIIIMIKSRRMRTARHVAHMWRRGLHIGF